MAHPLYVAFVWHQHQPDYRDPFGGPARLPWARLHAVKDYVHMAELVAAFPAIHCTFNFVPSLVDQLDAIGEGRYADKWQLLSLKENWTAEEKQFLRTHFFSIHPRLLERYPAYVRLRAQRDRPDLPDQYYRDLTAWFNLAWIDARAMARDETLSALAKKAENYTAADVATIIAKHRELVARVIPFHRELAQHGQIELSVSPYYHPILPLLIDQQSARQALPNLPLPATRFAHPEDASEQFRRAIDAHRRYLDTEPAGLWPSEGSVSEGLLALLPPGIKWLGADEMILARSLGTPIARDSDGNVTNPRVLYQPYTAPRPPVPGRPAPRPENPRAGRPERAIVFRDHYLSDRIGFAYQHMLAHDAAQELLWRLRVIKDRLADEDQSYLVSIILDGENAWEWYDDNGDPFFRELYGEIAKSTWLRTVTVNEYLQQNPPRVGLRHLAAGSWINGNFDTWIGEPAQNRAWEWLAQTRDALSRWLGDYAMADEAVLARAWDELYIAEGSDWFWWYSGRNQSAENAMYDELFRGHLQNVYVTIGLPVPDELKEPIRKTTEEHRARPVTTYIAPRLAAEETAGAEWNGAGVVEPNASTGTMQRADTKIARVFYGYSKDELFFRVETRADASVRLYLSTPHEERYNSRLRGVESVSRLALAWEIAVDPAASSVQVQRADGQEVWRSAPITVRATARVFDPALPSGVSDPAFPSGGHTTEIALSRQDLELASGDTVGFLVALFQGDKLVETVPAQGLQSFSLLEM